MKKLIIIASILGMLTVIIGAMGAHALKPHLNSDQLSWIDKGVHYQFIHCLMIYIAASLYDKFNFKVFFIAGWLFVIGVLLFSGSLYLLATREIIGIENWKWLGPLTPIGGMSMIVGWVFMIVGSWKIK